MTDSGSPTIPEKRTIPVEIKGIPDHVRNDGYPKPTTSDDY